MDDAPVTVQIGSVDIPFDLVRRIHLETLSMGTLTRYQGYILFDAMKIGRQLSWNYREPVVIRKGEHLMFTGVAVGARVLWRGKRLVVHLDGQSVFLEYGALGGMLPRGLTGGQVSAFIWRAMLSSRYPHINLTGFDEIGRERNFLFAIPLRNTIWTRHDAGYIMLTDSFVTSHSDQPVGAHPDDLRLMRELEPEWGVDSVKIVGTVRAEHLYGAWMNSLQRANATLDLLHSVGRLGASQLFSRHQNQILGWDLTTSLGGPQLSDTIFLKDLEEGGGYLFAKVSGDLTVPFDLSRLADRAQILGKLKAVHLVNSNVAQNPVRDDPEAATLSRALSWLRSGRDQNRPDEKVLRLWFAVESLLSANWFVRPETVVDRSVRVELKRAIKAISIPEGASLTREVLFTRLLRADVPIMSKLDQLSERIGVPLSTEERALLDRIRRLRGELVHKGSSANIDPHEIAHLEFVVEKLLYGCLDVLADKYPELDLSILPAAREKTNSGK